MSNGRIGAVILLATTLVACSASASALTQSSEAWSPTSDSAIPTSQAAQAPAATPVTVETAAATPAPIQAAAPIEAPAGAAGKPASTATSSVNVYAGTGVGMFAPGLASLPPRVYVPDEKSGYVIIIDPLTRKIIGREYVGASPEHITPDWNLKRLWVNVTFSNRLTAIHIKTGKLGRRISVPGPYNLYYSLDGTKAIVVLDSSSAPSKQLYFYDRTTWKLLKALTINHAGADHMDMSADGRYLLLSCEYSGYLIKVDVKRMKVVGELHVGGSPVDVRLAPDGKVFYVTNQVHNGVDIIDADTMHKVGFIATGLGAHGMAISRNAKRLYVTNRSAGSLSVISFASQQVISTRHIGGTPDMIAVSADGKELWISNRYSGSVSVVSARTSKVLAVIKTGGRPHGLTYFPDPGSLSLGHNGMYR